MTNRPHGRPEGAVTRGTTAPNRLRRVDRWIAATRARSLRAADRPLVVDLGFGASPVTTVELYERLRAVRPDVQVVGLEIEPDRVAGARRFLERYGESGRWDGLSFGLGGFELPVARPPSLVRAFNVLRQYEEPEAWRAWDRICAGLAPGGVLVEGTCDEIGRRAVWITLRRSVSGPAAPTPRVPARERSTGGGRNAAREGGTAEPLTITFAARVAALPCPSALAERLPKTLIHRNVPGEPIHRFLKDFDHAWAIAAPQSAFGPRQRWIAAVEQLAQGWPIVTRRPAGGRTRWRLGEVTLPWSAVAPP